jgi:tRNA 5-methylaminomethyl-2-thiouridine biosynthesis bifunctional protein
MNMPIPPQSYDAIVIGGGIAGISIIKSLKNNNLNNFLVIDSGNSPAQGTSGHDGALCHPYVGRGASRLQRLSMIAFNEARQIWANYWSGKGVLHLARNAENHDKNLMSERLLSQGFNLENAQVVSAVQAKALYGVSLSGTFFPGGGWVDLKQICQDLFSELTDQQVRMSCTVVKIAYRDKQWFIYDKEQKIIGLTPRLFLASGLGVKSLAASTQIDLPLKPVRGQLSTFAYKKESSWAKRRPTIALSGKAYCLPPVEMKDGSFQWAVGSSYDEHEEDLSVWQKSHQENLSLIQEMLGKECDLAEIEPVDAFVGIRCVASDRLPIMGPVKGYPGLYILTSLGSRGVMWSALAHQMFTEHLAEEIRHSAFLDARFFVGARLAGLGLSEDLVSALLPARFLAGASNSKPILPSA